MWDDFLFGLLFILGAAVWRAIKVKRKAPGEKHTVVDYADALLFPEQDRESPHPQKEPVE